MIPFIIKNCLLISIRSQYAQIKCSLLSQTTAFIKDLFNNYVYSHLQRENINFSYLTLTLKVIISIIQSYLIEMKYAMKNCKSDFYIDQNLFEYAFSLLISVIHLEPKETTINREFVRVKQKFIINTVTLSHLDSTITSTKQYQEIINEIMNDIPSLIDSYECYEYKGLLEFLKVIYVPYFLDRLTDSKSENIVVVQEFQQYSQKLLSNILENEQYTYENIENYFEFCLNDLIVCNQNLIKENVLNNFFKHILKLNTTHPFLLRLLANKLFEAFNKYPEVGVHYSKIIKKLLVARVFSF